MGAHISCRRRRARPAPDPAVRGSPARLHHRAGRDRGVGGRGGRGTDGFGSASTRRHGRRGCRRRGRRAGGCNHGRTLGRLASAAPPGRHARVAAAGVRRAARPRRLGRLRQDLPPRRLRPAVGRRLPAAGLVGVLAAASAVVAIQPVMAAPTSCQQAPSPGASIPALAPRDPLITDLGLDQAWPLSTLSFAQLTNSPDIESAVEYAVRKGVVVVAAAANETGSSASGSAATWYPAAYPGVLAVASVSPDGTASSDGARGKWIGIAA